MVTLPTVGTSGPPLMATPKSAVSSSDIMGVSNAQSGMLNNLQKTADDIGAPIAENEGAQSGLKSVTRDADGNVIVQEQPHPFIVGKLADVYENSARSAYAASLTTEAHTFAQQLAAKTMLPADQGGGGGDPAWFKSQYDAWAMQIAKNQRGGTQTATLQAGQQIGEQYFRNVLQQKTAIDGEAAKQALTTQLTRLDDQNVAFARQNYAGPEFKAGLDQYRRTLDQMVADPRMGMSKALADAKFDEAAGRYHANAIIGDVEKAYDPTKGGSWARASAAAERIRTDPGLHLNEHERTTYYNMAIGQVRLMEGERKAQAAALAPEGAKIAADLAKGVPVDQTTIDDFTTRAGQVGAVDQIRRVRQGEFEGKMAKQFGGMSNQQLAAVPQTRVGAPGTGLPANSLMGQPYNGPSQMDAGQVFALAQREVEAQGLVGVVPLDGPKFGIKTGSAAEWAAFMTRVSNAESSRNNGDNYTESFKHDGKNVVSRGLYSLSEHDAATYGLNNGQYFTPQQLANPNLNTASAVAIMKKLVGQGGTIQGSIGRYWSTVRDGTVLRGPGADAPGTSPPSRAPGGWSAIPPGAVARSQAQSAAAVAGDQRQADITAGRAGPLSDPFVADTYRTAVRQRLSFQLPEMMKAMDQFEIPSKDDADALGTLAAIGGTPEQQQKAAEIGARAQLGAAAKSMTTAQFEAAVSVKSQEYRERGTAAQQDAVAWARKLPQEIQTRFQNDPWGAAAWMGIPTQSTKQPIDFSNPQNLAAGLRARAADAGVIQANRGIPAFSALTPAELPAAKQVVQQGTPDQVAGFFGALNALPEDMRRATMQKLGESADVDPQMLAGDLFRTNPMVARSILTGLQQIKDPTFKEKGNTFDQTFVELFPPKDFAVDAASGSTPRTWMMVRSAAMARVKDMNFQKGQPGLDTSLDDVRQALNDVTGGVVNWNGASVIAPKYGMGAASFGKTMAALGPQDLQGAMSMSGTPLTARDMTAWNSPYKLQSVGEGRYLVFTEAGGVRRYVQQGGSDHLAHEGGPFMLDLTGAAKRVLSGG